MWVWAGLLACSTVKVEGRVVDGLTGEPVPGPYRMKATATVGSVAISCQAFDTEVGADGMFVFDRLCPGTPYHLETTRPDLWLVEVDEAPDGGWGQPTDLTAWRVPEAAGLYVLSHGEMIALKTDADVKIEQIKKSDQRARYPGNIPTTVAGVGVGDWLVQVGRSAIDDLKIHPLVPSGVRKFGNDDVTYTMEPWVYVGMRFSDDSTFERVSAVLDPSKIVDKQKGDRRVRYVSGAALPAGRYAVLKDDDRRMTLLDFGPVPTP